MAPRELRVVIVGAGASGIIAAIELKQKLGIKAKLFERNEGPGGTWHENVYPGCACDVPSHWYSYSKEQNPDWATAFAGQPEIQAYWERLYSKHELGKQTTYSVRFLRADWISERQVYVSQFESVKDTTQKFTMESELLISAIGGFSIPLEKPVGMAGIESFKGERFHSARWNYGIDLKNKRVAVIGNGCSASQFIPVISAEPTTQVVNFSRTPSWFVGRDNGAFSPLVKTAFRYVPFLQRIYRAVIVAQYDMRWLVWPLDNTKFRDPFQKLSEDYIKETAPKEYLDFLIPKYPIGCKRIILDPGYLQSLHKPNVRLVTDPIARITEKGVLCQSGEEHEADVLILATGFDVSARGFRLEIYGSDGKSVAEQWAAQDGPQAYLGTTLANYPNFFILMGPNVVTGHTSTVASIECQVDYIIKVLRPMAKSQSAITSIEVTAQAEERYNAWLHERLNNTVWQGGCQSWYRQDNGKITATWPGTFIHYWWKLRRPNFSHYVARSKNGTPQSLLVYRLTSLLNVLLLLGIMGASLHYFAWSPLKARMHVG